MLTTGSRIFRLFSLSVVSGRSIIRLRGKEVGKKEEPVYYTERHLLQASCSPWTTIFLTFRWYSFMVRNLPSRIW